MKKLNLLVAIAFIALLFTSCDEIEDLNSTEDCTRNAIIQNSINVVIPAHNETDGKTIFFIGEVKANVACDFDESKVAKEIKDLPKLLDFSYEISNMGFTADNGNGKSRLEFYVKITNLSDEVVGGLPYVTIKENGVLRSFTVNACDVLNAKSDCSFQYDLEKNIEIPAIKSVTVEKVEFLIIK